MSIQDKLDSVADVKIDSGVFKYIQIRVKSGSLEKVVIRGLRGAEYHADIEEEEAPQIRSLGFNAQCIGGGRINHDEAAKTIHVYGYSMGFGKADHRITVGKLEKEYPDYTITWSDEGY